LIKITYISDNLFYINLYGEDFLDNLDTIKCYQKIKFDKDKKCYTSDKKNTNYFLSNFNIQDIQFKPYKELVLEKLKTELEVKRIRINFDEKLLKYPPLKGKDELNVNYQIDDIKKVISYNRYYLALEMRLGKTYIMINALNHLFKNNLIDCCLIVCPSNILYNWKKEIIRFNSVNITEDDIYIVDIDNREPFNSNKKIVIMTYRNYLMLYEDAYKKIHKTRPKKIYSSVDLNIDKWFNNRCIIFDEAHRLSNMDNKTYKICNNNKNHFEYRYLLSGTPYPNRFSEIWGQLSIMDENILNIDYLGFIKKIYKCEIRYHSLYKVIEEYTDKIVEYKNLIKPYFTRRLTRRTIDLPKIIENKIYYDLSNKQLFLYKLFVNNTLNEIKNEMGNITKKEVLMKLPYILQVIQNPSILKENEKLFDNKELMKSINSFNFKDLKKLELLEDLLEKYIEEEHKKTIIWCYHPLSIQYLTEHFKKYKPVSINNDIKKIEDRDYYINLFKNNKDNKLLILSFLVFKEGINLNEASRVIYFERDYSLVNYNQSYFRNLSIDNKEEIIYNVFIANNTLEVSQDYILENKITLNKSDDTEIMDINNLKNMFEGKGV